MGKDAEHDNIQIDIPWLHSSIYHNTGTNNHYVTVPVNSVHRNGNYKQYTSMTPFLDIYPHDIPKSFNMKVYDSAGALLTAGDTGFYSVDLYFTFNDL